MPNSPNITFLMDPNHREGAGSFYQRSFLAYLFAQAKQYNFIHAENTFSNCHDVGANAGQIYQDWEKVFSFLGEKHEFDFDVPTYIAEGGDVDNKTYHLPFELSYNFLENLNPCDRENLIAKARDKFHSNLKRFPELFPEKNAGFVIALHLRDLSKGDPTPSGALLDWQMFSYDYGLPDNNPKYYSELYANAINNIIREYKIKQPILHIHSTGKREVFDYFLTLLDDPIEVKFFLNFHPPKSFLDLIYADILIGSHSSFSWLAILLRNGPTFIRRNFRHFLPVDTKFIEETLFKNKGVWKRFMTRVQMKYSYLKFKRARKKII